MNKAFVVTPKNFVAGDGYYTYPWFAWGATIEEVQNRFPDCDVVEGE